MLILSEDERCKEDMPDTSGNTIAILSAPHPSSEESADGIHVLCQFST